MLWQEPGSDPRVFRQLTLKYSKGECSNEMDKEFGMKIIDAASYGVVSMVDQESQPYGLPLSLVRDENISFLF